MTRTEKMYMGRLEKKQNILRWLKTESALTEVLNCKKSRFTTLTESRETDSPN
jgi:hypothetical protein